MNPNKPDADKAAEEKYDKLLETVKIALSYRDFGVLNEYLKSIGEEKIASSRSGKERTALEKILEIQENEKWMGKSPIDLLFDINVIAREALDKGSK